MNIYQLLKELWEGKELTWTLFVREISSRYKQSFFGLFWVIILPVLTLVMFMTLNKSGIIKISTSSIPYPIYGMLGFTLWSLFSSTLSYTTASLVNAGSMIVKINFPKSSLVLSASGIAIFEFLIRLILILILFLWYDFHFSLFNLFKGLIISSFLYVLALGIGFIFCIIAGVLRDVLIVLPIMMNVLMMLTPVMYPIDSNSILGQLNLWNPLNYMVNFSRLVILDGVRIETGLIYSVFTSIFVLFIALRFFCLAQMKIAERI
ncbi:MAG: ABC-2 type transporter superfamily [uncultured bacterium]|nr:MAG: ABC-2 type transporter superfamily [uncultured bacterium]